MQHKQGFTLIELLVVVLIIGILAAVALPQYQLAVAKSRVFTMIPILNAITKAEYAYVLSNGKMPATFEELDITLPGNPIISNNSLWRQQAVYEYFTIGLASTTTDRCVGQMYFSDGSYLYIFMKNPAANTFSSCEAIPNSFADKVCKSLPVINIIGNFDGKNKYKVDL